jgi:hypothetical protein
MGAVAVDFPVNRYFQLIGEARATKYVGGRTPNAFEQDPIDLLGGVRIFPTRLVRNELLVSLECESTRCRRFRRFQSE